MSTLIAFENYKCYWMPSVVSLIVMIAIKKINDNWSFNLYCPLCPCTSQNTDFKVISAIEKRACASIRGCLSNRENKVNSYTLRSKLVHPKDKIPKEVTYGVVYHIQCEGCHSTCMEETERRLSKRVSEHHRSSSPPQLDNTQENGDTPSPRKVSRSYTKKPTGSGEEWQKWFISRRRNWFEIETGASTHCSRPNLLGDPKVTWRYVIYPVTWQNQTF